MTLTQFNKTLTSIFRRMGSTKHVFELSSNSLLPERLGKQEQWVILDWPKIAVAGTSRFRTFIESVELQAIIDEPEPAGTAVPPHRPGMAGMNPNPATKPPVAAPVFSNDADRLQQILAAQPLRTMAHKPEDWEAYLRDHHFVFGKLTRDQLLQLTLRINTDCKGFLHWTSPNPRRRIQFHGFSNGSDNVFELSLQVRMYSPAGEERGEVRVRLDSCEELSKYPGFVAIDFGNNSSTIACLAAEHFSAEEVQLVNADPRVSAPGSQPSLESKLRIIRHEPPKPQQDPDGSRGLFGVTECCTGQDALRNRAVEGCLIEGLKPLVADPNEDPPLQLDLESGQRAMRKGDAGEMFIAELFKAFHRERLAKAIPVTLTYPTTYGLGEIERLRVAVTRAYYRAMLMPGLEISKLWDEMPKIIGEQIDEATAAAFYYLYRDFIEGPGKTAALKYIYPQGLNLLLYDCGGGTTDIALVHAYPRQITRTDAEGRRRETWEVKLSLLGRTGHRSFGGDNITAATAIAIKWLIASQLDSSIPAPSAELAATQILKIREQADKVLPTAWKDLKTGKPKYSEPNKVRACRAATNDLVRYAEEVKIRLSEKYGQKVQDAESMPDLTGYSALDRLIATRCAAPVARPPGEAQGERKNKSQILTNVRNGLFGLLPVIDELIRSDVELTVNAANNLIRDRLVDPTSSKHAPVQVDEQQANLEGETDVPALSADSCIHWVYVVGKASQYPLILNRLREGLEVADLQSSDKPTPDANNPAADDEATPAECRLVLEKEMLKGAVARGAVLARMFCKNVQDVEIVYDRKMPLKLAFEMGIRLAGRGIKPMFKPDAFYHRLTPFEFDAADRGENNAQEGDSNESSQTLRIYRRWPGMAGSGERDGWEDYLLFEFAEQPQGRIRIGYEPIYEGSHEYAFLATVLETGQRSLGVEIVKEMFQSPLQRGKL